MKFLFISPRFSGGIGGHASMLAEQLTNAGHEVTKMHTPHIPIKNLKNPSFALFGSIKGILTKQRYDIIHGFNVPSAFALKYSKGEKKVLSIHGVFSEQVKKLHSGTVSSMATETESRVLTWADKLTTDSRATQIAYKKKLNLDFEYLPSPIDSEKLDKIPYVEKNTNQVIYLGRNSTEKGIDILKKIESRINAKVVYCTNLPWEDAMIHLKKSKLLVVPSRMESLPTNIKEALYLKIPVVATNVGGIPELIINQKNGILVSSENSEELLESINSLLNNEKLSASLTSNGFDFINENMTWKKILPEYIRFYKKLLES